MNYIPGAIALFIGLLVILYVVWPLLSTNAESLVADSSDEALELILRKDTVLRNIKDLEFDYQTGKLNEEDFTRLNYQLRQQAVALLKRLENSTTGMTDLDQEVESAISEARQQG